MEDLFKKTMNYFNTGSVDDEFVGQIVEVGAMKLRIIRKIAEGKSFSLTHLQNQPFWFMCNWSCDI